MRYDIKPKKTKYLCTFITIGIGFIIILSALISFSFGSTPTEKASLVLSFLSVIFGFTSTFGIAATILVYLKQKKDDTKKVNSEVSAIKQIISDECRRNYWIHDVIKRKVEYLIEHHEDTGRKSHLYMNQFLSVIAKENKRGYQIECFYQNSLVSGGFIPFVKIDKTSDLLLIAAKLDNYLYKEIHEHIIFLRDMEHVLQYLIEFNQEVKEQRASECLEYCTDTLQETLQSLKRIYSHCTGSELKEKNWIIR